MAKEAYEMTTELPSPGGSIESNSFGKEPNYDDTPVPKPSLSHRIIDGFRRDPNLRATPHGVVGANGKVFDVEAAAQATADSPLARKLKSRHLQMIAIGGSIGRRLSLDLSSQRLLFFQAQDFSSLPESLCPTAVRPQS